MKNKRPLISVVIPVYNAEHYIKKAVESVLNQTYDNIELIVINDGSTDGTLKVLRKLNHIYPKIKNMYQENSGVSVARNNGLQNVKGEYVCFLDSDDWLDKEAINFLYTLIKNKDRVIAACERNTVEIVEEKTKITNRVTKEETVLMSSGEALFNIGAIDKFNLQSASHKLFPVYLINQNGKVRFNESITNGEDGLFVFDVLTKANGLIYSSVPQWNVLQRVGSTTMSGYSEDLKTSLCAVKKMLVKSKGNLSLEEQLKVYYTIRTMQLIDTLIVSNPENYTELKELRTHLVKYKKYFLKSDLSYLSYWKKTYYYVLLYCSPWIIKTIIQIEKTMKNISTFIQ